MICQISYSTLYKKATFVKWGILSEVNGNKNLFTFVLRLPDTPSDVIYLRDFNVFFFNAVPSTPE